MSVVACAVASLMSAWVLQHWISLSLFGVTSGVIYGVLSTETYAALARQFLKEDRNVVLVLSLLALKFAALGVFVFALANSDYTFLWSSLGGLGIIILAGICAGSLASRVR